MIYLPAAEFQMKAARPWNALSRVLEVSECRASQARQEHVPASQPPLGQWDFYFWPGSAGSLSLPLSFLVGLRFKVTLSGLDWCFLSYATREVSVSEVDRTQTAQLVTGLCQTTSVGVQRCL